MMKRNSKQPFDRLELMTIKELEVNGRLTITALAKKLGTSKATARRKLDKLLQENVIQVVADVSPPILGYDIMAYIGINTTPGRVNQVAEHLAILSNVNSLSITTGRFDILVRTLFKSTEELSGFLKNTLGRTPGISSTETMLSLETKKCSASLITEESIPSRKRSRRTKKTK